jgi:para-nitrobenzyl esterase
MKIHHLLLLTLCLAVPAGAQQSPGRKAADPNNPLIKKFDLNGDGVIDDNERRGVREKMRQMQNKPGAMTPSGKTETIGNRLVTEMQYPSSDGRMIPCVLSMPKGEGPFPVLVTIHGGQGNRDLGYIRTMAAPNNLSPTVNAFNEQPWAILAISYRAGNGALFGMEHDDVIAGIRFAKTLPKVDPARVGVVGGSHGGHLALVAAEKMGNEFLCVAVGSPWMTDPLVYMTGDPNKPPLSLVPQPARDELVKNGRSMFSGLTRGRGMSEAEAKKFLAANSIEAQADKIVIPTLFITSRGDDQAPHVLIEPMIQRMQAAKKDVSVYTAEKSPHGFYWARTVSLARSMRGEKSAQEEAEEREARSRIIAFFTQQFARKDVKAVPSPTTAATSATAETLPPKATSEPPAPGASARERAMQGRGGAGTAGRGMGGGLAANPDAAFTAMAGESGKATKEAFLAHYTKSGGGLASRPDILERIFDRLDADKDGALTKEEHAGLSAVLSGFGGRRGGRATPPSSPAPAPAPEAPNQPASKPSEPASPPAAKSKESAKRTDPVRLDAGLVIGESKSGERIFRGIPYAVAPVGEQRWKAPQPPKPWTGVREAIEFGAPAFQGETFFPQSMQSEDCLSLNVWSPADAKPGASMPVLVWFHGGAFIQGSGAQPRYDGSELARRGIVVVTINYRLGPFGIFAHPALTAEAKPGEPLANFCLLDMMEALRWVNRNIAAFGGDPKNVTISGSSAGATSCLYLMGIPVAQPLFHKAIIQSSGGMRNIQDLAQAESSGARLADYLSAKNATARSLRALDPKQLSVGTSAIRRLDLPVKPIVDGRLVTATVEEIFTQGKQSRIPVLIGACNGESGGRGLDDVGTSGAFGFQLQLAADMLRAGQSVHLFQFTFVPPAARATRPTAKHGEAVAYSFGTHGQPVSAQYGFRNQQVAARAMQSRAGGRAAAVGAGEADDSGGDPDASAEGDQISQAVLDYWTAFMRTGNPAAPNRSEWPAYTSASAPVMVFGNSGVRLQKVATR